MIQVHAYVVHVLPVSWYSLMTNFNLTSCMSYGLAVEAQESAYAKCRFKRHQHFFSIPDFQFHIVQNVFSQFRCVVLATAEWQI